YSRPQAYNASIIGTNPCRTAVMDCREAGRDASGSRESGRRSPWPGPRWLRPGAAGAWRRLRQRIEPKLGPLATQPQVAERAFGDSGRQFEAIDQLGRGDDPLARLTAKLLDARRGVDRVAEKNDLLLYRAHFAGHHRTAMEPGPDREAHPEFAGVVGRAAGESLHRAETRFDAARRRDPVLERPGRDEFVADIAVDLAALRHDRLGQIQHEPVEQPVKVERP